MTLVCVREGCNKPPFPTGDRWTFTPMAAWRGASPTVWPAELPTRILPLIHPCCSQFLNKSSNLTFLRNVWNSSLITIVCCRFWWSSPQWSTLQTITLLIIINITDDFNTCRGRLQQVCWEILEVEDLVNHCWPIMILPHCKLKYIAQPKPKH